LKGAVRARAYPFRMRAISYGLLHIRFMLMKQWNVQYEQIGTTGKTQNRARQPAKLAMLLLRLLMWQADPTLSQRVFTFRPGHSTASNALPNTCSPERMAVKIA